MKDSYTNNSADTDKILVINSITMAEDNVKAALNSPNTEFSKYRVVIMSPTAQSGLSYDIPDIFHSIYGIFGNASNSSGDACQMLNVPCTGREQTPSARPAVQFYDTQSKSW
jgi:hypothetical protein